MVVVQKIRENFLTHAEGSMAGAAFPLNVRQREANLRQARETRIFGTFAHARFLGDAPESRDQNQAPAAAACVFSSGLTKTLLAISTTCRRCHHSRSLICVPSLLEK